MVVFHAFFNCANGNAQRITYFDLMEILVCFTGKLRIFRNNQVLEYQPYPGWRVLKPLLLPGFV